jgi:hypothetical protein
MANLKAIADRTHTLSVDLGDGDVLNVTYRPAAYTPEFEQKAQAGIDAGDRDSLGRMVADIVTDWDLYEDAAHKVKVPLTVDRLRSVPMIVLAPVMESIGGDLRPNLKSGVRSAAGSMEP